MAERTIIFNQPDLWRGELDIPAVYVKNPLPEAQIHAFFI